MDASEAQPLQRSRPPYPRASSRSSTSTTHTRMTSQSGGSLTSHTTSSPQLSNSHPVHRLHHAACIKPSSSPRPPTRHSRQLSREASSESPRQQAVSSFLQEKLQKERKAESEKMAHGPALLRINTDLSASLDLGRPAQHSPIRMSYSEDLRPMSSAGIEPGRRQGLGVKDMEHVISGLHKQNFDLKLELYHRREKQALLETNIDSLESDKKQMVDMNDALLEELEKRDKAVEEAVAMIVMLEAKMDQLMMGERNMVLQVEREEEGFFCTQDMDAQYMKPEPETRAPEVARLEDDVQVITRMPSFLSERSENTENLRTVYLGVRGSVLSLPRVAEGASEAENGPVNGLASPTLSVLSESSFASVYGKKSQDEGYPPPVDKPMSLDGVDANPHMAHHEEFHDMGKGRTAVLPVRAATANCFSRGGHTSDPFHTITGIIGHGPMQIQIEHPGGSHGILQEGFRPLPHGRERRGSQPAPSNMPQGRKLTKEEKREALRAVMTDANGGVRLHDQNFPPTPDTISTSTLHRMRSSNESLSQQHEGRNKRTSAIYHDTNERHPEKASGVSLREKPVPATVQGAVQDIRASHIYHGVRIERPRSASETTVSYKRVEDWDSDSDDDSDHRSLESSLDIWMRESTKPAQEGGRLSPDQFRFPATASKGAWANDSMFRPNSAQPAAQGIERNADYMHDLFPLRQALFTANVPPPLPDRKSSLHARTISTSESIRLVPTSPKQIGETRAGHFRRQSDGTPMRSALRTPVQQQLVQPPPPNSDQKKNHYPPITGQQGPRSGLNRLFRRSIGNGSSTNTTESAPSSATDASFPDGCQNIPNMGVPSWVSRNLPVDDDRTGATPPPIMLNPRQMRRNTAGAEAMPDFMGPTPNTPDRISEMTACGRKTPTAQKPANGLASPTASGTGIRRKWLPGFRQAASNLKHRAG